jgi:hypothetical protein
VGGCGWDGGAGEEDEEARNILPVDPGGTVAVGSWGWGRAGRRMGSGAAPRARGGEGPAVEGREAIDSIVTACARGGRWWQGGTLPSRRDCITTVCTGFAWFESMDFIHAGTARTTSTPPHVEAASDGEMLTLFSRNDLFIS